MHLDIKNLNNENQTFNEKCQTLLNEANEEKNKKEISFERLDGDFKLKIEHVYDQCEKRIAMERSVIEKNYQFKIAELTNLIKTTNKNEINDKKMQNLMIEKKRLSDEIVEKNHEIQLLKEECSKFILVLTFLFCILWLIF